MNYSPSGHNASRVVDTDGIAPIVMENHGTVTAVAVKSLWTGTQAKMITKEGNVKRYIDSDVVDEFKEGQVADISFPNGYNKGPRVHDECPAINGTTTASSFIVKTKNGLKIPLYKDTKQLRETIEQNDLYKGEVVNLDLYNRSVYKESQALTEPHHNSQRLWDDLDIEEKIEMFNKKFNRVEKYSGEEFYKWHHILTGSCTAGRDNFVRQNNLDLKKLYTVDEFIKITKDSYGGNIIKKLCEEKKNNE